MSYVIGILATASLMAAWVAVQNAWRATFPTEASGDDVLERRSGCHTCAAAPGCSAMRQGQLEED